MRDQTSSSLSKVRLLLWKSSCRYFCSNPQSTGKGVLSFVISGSSRPTAQLRRIMVALGDSYFPAKKQIVTRYIQGHLPRCIQRLYMVIIHNKILCCSPQLKGGCMVLFLWSLSLVFMGLYTFRQGKGAKKFYYPGEGSLQQCSWPSYGHGHYIWERISSVTCLVLTTQVLSVSFCAAAIPNCHSETGDVFYCGSVKVCLQLKGEPRS